MHKLTENISVPTFFGLWICVAVCIALVPVTSGAKSGVEITPVADKPSLGDLFPIQEPAEPTEAGPAYSDPVKIDEGFGRQRISAVPGEAIDPRSGALLLSATDLSVPGNGGLDLVVSRTRRSSFFAGQSDTYLNDGSFQELIADWTLDIPNIELRSVYDYRQGAVTRWHTPLSNNLLHLGGLAQGACSSPYPPKPSFKGETTGGPNYSPGLVDYFGGVRLKGIPGHADRELLIRTEEQTLYISSRYATPDHWIVRCESSDQLPGVFGQFVVSAPDGTTYYFDQASKGNSLAPSSAYPYYGKMRVFVSRIVDRNGNWIQYEYDDSLFGTSVLQAPGYDRSTPDLRDYAYVKRIHASDGREVAFEWEANLFSPANQPACRNNDYGTCGAPRYRLKRFSHAGKDWIFRYNDIGARDDNNSRYLASVTLPSGQSYQYRVTASGAISNPPPCQGYPYSGTSDTWVKPADYRVTFPSGAVVDYTMMTRRFERRGNGQGQCWYATAVKSRQVNDLVGGVDTTQWCYSPADRDATISWTHELSPTRFVAYSFQREGTDGAWWGEGLLATQQVRPAQAQCNANIGDPGGSYLRKTTFEHVRGQIISKPSIGNPAYAPGYAAAVVAPRVVARQVIDEPGSGVFETTFDKFDSFKLPKFSRESLVGQASTEAGARRWLMKYDNRAARFDLNINSVRAYGYWFAADTAGVEFWASRNGGPEFLVHASGSSSNNIEPFEVNNFIPGNAVYTFAMYPAGQHAEGRKLVEIRDITINGPAIQEHRAFSWQLGRTAERCVVARDIAGCSVVENVVQSDRSYYNYQGNKISQVSYGKTSDFLYTAEGDVESQIDPNSRATSLLYYKRGTPQLIVLPSEKKQENESLVVNDDGTIRSITNASGIQTIYGYDSLLRLKSVDYASGSDTAISWSGDGRTRTAIRGALKVVSAFDGFGRLIKQSTGFTNGGETVTVEYQHDAAGNVVFESYPETGINGSSNGMRFEYDALDRRVRTIRTSDQASSSIVFEPPEKQLFRDFSNRLTTSSYRSFGAPTYEHLLRVDQPFTAIDENEIAAVRMATTVFDPDQLGFVRSVVQGGKTRRYAVDGRRFLVKEFAPELGQPQTADGYNIGYCRNNLGQVIGKTIGNVCTNTSNAGLVVNSYDWRNRKIGVDYRDTASPDLTVAYTGTGKVSGTTKGGTSTSYYYDAMENLRLEKHRIDSQIFSLRYTYDDLNSLASITYPSGKHYMVTSDALGRVRAISGIVSEVNYHPTGQVQSMTLQNGKVTTVTLTTDKQPDTMVTQGGGVALVNLNYGYDVNGNASSLIDALKPEQSLDHIGYDELNRLTETRYSTSKQVYRRGYDDTGNVLFDQTPELPMLRYSYDNNNRLATLSGSLLRSLTYDALGNLQSDGNRNLSFAFDGNLMHASTATVAKTMTYDGRDRLTREDGPQGTVYYVYSGEHLMLEYYPAQKKYIEYLYAGSLLISSRTVENAHLADADGDGVNDISEFLGMGQPAD